MAEDFSRPPNPHRLYRNRERGVLCGVCAGLADYFNIDVVLVRIVCILSLFLSGSLTFIAYIIACIAMPVRRGKTPRMNPEEDQFWRGVERRPEVTFSNLRYQFRDLEDRLADLECTVTSKEWKLRRQFRDLEN